MTDVREAFFITATYAALRLILYSRWSNNFLPHDLAVSFLFALRVPEPDFDSRHASLLIQRLQRMPELAAELRSSLLYGRDCERR
jgi:hypothetical protein